MRMKDVHWCYRCGGVVNDPAAHENSKCSCKELGFNGPKEPPKERFTHDYPNVEKLKDNESIFWKGELT